MKSGELFAILRGRQSRQGYGEMFPLVAPSPKGLPSHIPNHIVKEIVAVTVAGKVVCVHSTAVASTAPCPLPNAHTNTLPSLHAG